MVGAIDTIAPSILRIYLNSFIGSCPELGSWKNVQRLENQSSTESIGDSLGGEEAGEE